MTTVDFRMARPDARRLGAYYTADDTALYMVRQVIADTTTNVLEPSFGDGSFLRALKQTFDRHINTFGVEIDSRSHEHAIASGLISGDQAILANFLEVEPFPVDVVVGNPPFVRLRHLSPQSLRAAMRTASDLLGHEMATSGSLWMAFALHALRFLKPGGRLALVLPFELTHVKYARPLWRVLGDSFDSLRVVRVRQRLFPDIMQEVVILFATGFGGSTADVRLDVYERSCDLEGTPSMSDCLPIASILKGQREFVRALLPRKLKELLSSVQPRTTSVGEHCAFNIGYVSGDRRYFHPTRETIAAYGLPSWALRQTVTSTRSLKGAGIGTSGLGQAQRKTLFFPESDPASEALHRYVWAGEEANVHKKYKCRVRTPWYLVPGVTVPQLLLSVFSSEPILMLNDAGLAASNSILCGRIRLGTPPEFAARWYTSLTRLYLELQVHSLGGGVLVLIPGEVGRVRIVHGEVGETIEAVDRRLRVGDVAGAYRCGDDILTSELGISAEDIDEIRNGIETLTTWRTGSYGSPPLDSSSPNGSNQGIHLSE